jgi:GntR family transcriptional regulator/MocR family aminotransferase
MLTYNLEKADGPKYLALYNFIKSDILSGKIAKGEKLPSRRLLADHLQISVVTVENAYKILTDEGYVISKARSGFYVMNDSLSMSPKKSDIYENYQNFESSDESSESGFPVPSYVKTARKILSESPEALSAVPTNKGASALRKAISGYLERYRGMKTNPDNIIIGAGAEYLYQIFVDILGNDKVYAVEKPCYKKIKGIYAVNGCGIQELEMDGRGISQQSLDMTTADILHVTPYHDINGINADAGKKMAYLVWAKKKGGIIIEDDYSSEFSVGLKPTETLYSMDADSMVIYENTFTKSLSRSIRIAYAILPDSLMNVYENKLGFLTCPVPVFDQYVLARFIDEGKFENHLNRTRRLLKYKQ